MAESLIKGNRIKLGGRARQSPFFFLFIYFSFHFHLLFFSSSPISLSPHHPILPELRDKRGEREREAIIDSDVRCECCGRSLTEKMGGATISFFSFFFFFFVCQDSTQHSIFFYPSDLEQELLQKEFRT